jgi:hypothetical protein
MATNLPQRPETHQLSDESVRFFRDCLPREWVCDEPKNDYGIDLRVGLTDEHFLSGESLVVQIKASETSPPGPTVAMELRVTTYNYLWNLLEVALLVRYIAAEREAYWLLLKDVNPPSQNQETFTVHVPRDHKLSQDPWHQIAEYVANIHQRKLDAVRHQHQRTQ